MPANQIAVLIHMMVKIATSTILQNLSPKRDLSDNNASNEEYTALFQLGSIQGSENLPSHREGTHF